MIKKLNQKIRKYFNFSLFITLHNNSLFAAMVTDKRQYRQQKHRDEKARLQPYTFHCR